MSVQAEDFLQFAQQLLAAQSNDEMHRRNAISRAYYSAYHRCDELAKALSLPSSNGKGGVHARLYHRFIRLSPSSDVDLSDEQVRELNVMGRMADRAKQCRNKADYKLEEEIDSALAQEQMVRCQTILAKAAALSGGTS